MSTSPSCDPCVRLEIAGLAAVVHLTPDLARVVRTNPELRRQMVESCLRTIEARIEEDAILHGDPTKPAPRGEIKA